MEIKAYLREALVKLMAPKRRASKPRFHLLPDRQLMTKNSGDVAHQVWKWVAVERNKYRPHQGAKERARRLRQGQHYLHPLVPA